MRVDHDQERADGIHPKRDETLFTLSVRIFPSQRKVVLKDRHGVGKADAVSLLVRFRFSGIPLVLHIPSV